MDYDMTTTRQTTTVNSFSFVQMMRLRSSPNDTACYYLTISQRSGHHKDFHCICDADTECIAAVYSRGMVRTCESLWLNLWLAICVSNVRQNDILKCLQGHRDEEVVRGNNPRVKTSLLNFIQAHI